MAGLSDNARGALLMVGTMTGFTVNDAFVKAATVVLPLPQAMVIRAVGVALLMMVVARVTGGSLRLPPGRRDRVLVLVRTAAETGGTWFYLTALMHMPLANASAVLQATPLAVTLGGALVFGERLGWRRLLAVAAGLLGVLLIVRPGAEGFSLYSLHALVTVLLITVRDLAARQLSTGVSSVFVAHSTNLGVLAFFAVAAIGQPWVPVPALAWAQMAGAALSIVAGYVLAVMATRVGELGAIAPFRYSALLVALILGVVAFGDWPDAVTLLGAAIVVGSGLFALSRERRLHVDPASPLH